MPLFRVTVKQMKLTSGVRIEPGMSVDVGSPAKSGGLRKKFAQSVKEEL